ncbi:MAG: FKBP-type peptidyl-prolyl cis-trans isomerase [Bacteroidales bacterium]|nr:FKBP-type peptidyl-prolyl cis-trans isomerase [Bacteroidales bacterium]
MKNSIIFIFSLMIITIGFSCQSNDCKNSKVHSEKEIKDALLRANKQLVENEDEKIEDFIKRYGWKMHKTGTGLRYWIYKQGKGKKAENNKVAKFNYSVKLLTGDEIYTSKISGPKEFLIGRGEVESGIEEGILLLCVGDRVKFIVPSHLAFGLQGDQNKIPAKACLVYDIELLEINDKN